MPKLVTRGFVLTDWNMNSEENYLHIMKAKEIRFIAYGKEICPTSGKPHHQCFLYFYNERSYSVKNLGKIGKWWGDTHCFVKEMLGNFENNEDYCKKDGIYKKLGIEPAQGFRGDLKETVRLITKGEILPYDLMLENPQCFNLYKNMFSIARNSYMKTQFRTTQTKGFWFWGGTGVGKSHAAFRDYSPKTHFRKDLNVNWWDNYEQQKIVVFNEFRGQIKYAELLDLVDKWPKEVPIRNNPSIPFTSEIVVITSCSPPTEIYYNKLTSTDSIAQFNRRFQVVEFKTQNDAEVVYW